MLSLAKFPNFCGYNCHEFLGHMWEGRAGWQDICPWEERSEWNMFHVTCVKRLWGWEDRVHDREHIKRDLMHMLLELQFGMNYVRRL